MNIARFHQQPGLSVVEQEKVLKIIKSVFDGQAKVINLQSESCFYVQHESPDLSSNDEKFLIWLMGSLLNENSVSRTSFFEDKSIQECRLLVEIGPRLNFSTPFSTNAVSICSSVGLKYITRIERSVRYLIQFESLGKWDNELPSDLKSSLIDALHDKMTQCCYESPITTFDLDVCPESVIEVDVIGRGRKALEEASHDLGLAFDSWDLEYYTDLFVRTFKRNPTSVECFDLAQSNSEHCRHWYFRGRFIVDGEEKEQSLLKMVMSTQKSTNSNNVIKFSDNSSAIEGYHVKALYPQSAVSSSPFHLKSNSHRHIVFTAETHNFPTGVAPFPGATTGTGGRIRDVQATGRGAHVIAGTAGYCFGNLNIPGYSLPWEDADFKYPSNFARPLDIAVEASNGASDYGNKFGEPILTGFARSFGLMLENSERREWVKPIMFTGGIGSVSSLHIDKDPATMGMEVVKVGGPVFRIGLGGGSASSINIQGDNKSDLDFNAVQRGDAEMEQKMNRVIRACIEREEKNPICSIHDQGAGGNGNVLKEICYPAGALIRRSGFQLGDPTLSIMEIWGAEYQESNALLVKSKDAEILKQIAHREKCPVSFVGSITDDKRIRFEDDRKNTDGPEPDAKKPRLNGLKFPIDLDLETVLGDMPRKVFNVVHKENPARVFKLPEDITVSDALDRVLRLPSVASKRYLTNKVDRSVTGLVAQQQCVGPLHTPLADVAVVALSHFDTTGSATAIGEQPIKCLVDPSSGARVTVGESLTNLVFAQITSIRDVKCSANWMWPAKLPGEDACLYDACSAMCDVMKELGIAADGGKDSLSMSARLGKDEIIKAPGSLVISVYAPCPDITGTVTPDLKCPGGKGVLLYVPLCPGKYRLGGSALAQCFKSVGNDCPDLESPELFIKAFEVTQSLIKERSILSGHDVSDGGLLTCVSEMAFAGNCGVDLCLKSVNNVSTMELLFAEELGLVLEVQQERVAVIMGLYENAGVACHNIGSSYLNSDISEIFVSIDGVEVFRDTTSHLRDVWEATSFQLERRQANPSCVKEEEENLKLRKAPRYHMSFDPSSIMNRKPVEGGTKPKVAVIREEGSNGDREMVSALYMAGFEVWDVNMQDLCSETVTLESFRGVVFVGGFSYADVFGSAKGWAAIIKHNDKVHRQFDDFFARTDTFSLCVCNGCQLMAYLGWVGLDADDKENGNQQGVVLSHNVSERFESRFVNVVIEESPSIMMKGMQGSVLGIWIAHGEGQMVFKSRQILDSIKSDRLIPLKYADDDGRPTLQYPLNPNGSAEAIAALCSQDGRHLAMMPHPERCILPWQWPWMPESWKTTMDVSPWLCMFKNAFDWCVESAYVNRDVIEAV